jgi:hypothetical protein
VIERPSGPLLRCLDVHRGTLAAAERVLADGFPEPPPKVTVDSIRRHAETLHWRAFEYTAIADGDVALAWEDGLAARFNRFFCERIVGCLPKPIVFDFRPGTRSRLGEHRHDRIRLRADIPDPGKWRVLIHELAHYRVKDHPRRAFVREMALAYQTWLEFLRESGTRPDGGS